MSKSSNSVNTSNSKVKAAIKALAARFAEKHNLNQSVIESLSTGVLDRINIFGEDEFEKLSREQKLILIGESVRDYFECARIFHERYINEDAFRERVQNMVYNLLKEDK